MTPESPILSSLQQLLLQSLRMLHTLLIEPLALYVHNAARLTIVPYGDLHYLPFNLLYDGTSYLIDRYEVVLLPVAGLITRASPQRKANRARVLAYSENGKFPNILAEAEAIRETIPADVYTEADAQQFQLAQPPVQILHVAAHGRQRVDYPEFSSIQLADGLVYTDDLLQYDLSYELVVFSGCETGRAQVTAGDELIGLGRSILYAGAGAFVASLYSVEDAHTVTLIRAFYSALQRGLVSLPRCVPLNNLRGKGCIRLSGGRFN